MDLSKIAQYYPKYWVYFLSAITQYFAHKITVLLVLGYIRHSPPMMRVIHSDPMSESLAIIDLQTLDMTLDTYWIILDASKITNCKTFAVIRLQTLDLRSHLWGGSVVMM